LIYKDLSVKFTHDYDFYEMPLEYNTWLLFRNVVDLILMSDFTCYILLALSCAQPTEHSWPIIIGRWVAGIILFLFNLWVKLDAHRVVKDYAWYWGDFFFLEDVHLTFDGVFEMAPHPMYSIGYAGYYGICLMSASYTLFAMSVLAHAAQFAFLIIVENPHIEKTYNPKPTVPRKKSSSIPLELVTCCAAKVSQSGGLRFFSSLVALASMRIASGRLSTMLALSCHISA
jgi:phosphatidylethanolamine N-methyltransferase